MLINNILPRQELSNYIRLFRIIDFDFTSVDSRLENSKAYRPRIEHCLQFTPFDRETVHYPGDTIISEEVAFFGQHNQLNHRKVGRKYLNIQVVFQPGVLHRLLKISLDELTNVYSSAETFFGRRVHLVNEQISECNGYDQMIATIETYLLKLTASLGNHYHPIERIAREMLNPYKLNHIDWYARQSNLCFRQFDRIFKVHTGISPKEYINLVQLDLAYLLKNREPMRDWLSIALESGFYDYQHLSKTYKKFTGYTPTAFFELEQKAPERYFGDYEK